MRPEHASDLPLTPTTFRRWVTEVGNRRVSSGLSVAEAMEWARTVWNRGGIGIASLSFDQKLPDRLYALSQVVAASEPGEADLGFEVSVACFEMLERVDWQSDQIGEKADLLGRFGYLAWLTSRRSRRWPAMFTWERRAVDAVLGQESVPDFLAVPAVALSDEVGSRFLSEPPVLLAVCNRLRELANQFPVRALQDATAVHSWVVRHRGRAPAEEGAYFQTELEVILAATAKNCGRYQESVRWLDVADQSCNTHLTFDCLFARSSFLRLAVAMELRNYLTVLKELPSVRVRFEALGMQNYVARCRWMGAATLKELGRDDEAFAELRDFLVSSGPEIEPWLRALAMTGLAEIEGRRQQFQLAMSTLASAWDALKDGSAPVAVAHFHAVRGELQRDQGQLAAAIGSYRTGVSIYSEAGMASQAAYLSIVLAETLVAAGREQEAIDAILCALPAIENLSLVREGVAAVALLRESIRRQKADPELLRALRIQLQEMREGDLS